MTRQRDLLASCLGELLGALKCVRPGAALTGPELILLAEGVVENPPVPPRVYVSVVGGVAEVRSDADISLILADFDREGAEPLEAGEIDRLFEGVPVNDGPDAFAAAGADGRSHFGLHFAAGVADRRSP